jgi:serine/threonine protein kinase
VYYCNYLPHPTSGQRVPALVMEYVKGETLGRRLMGAMDLPEAVGVGAALCDAVIFIHSKGLVHGDLHEDNVMVPPNGGAKVIDLLNDRTLSEFTSGARRAGTCDDVESLKAILERLLTRVGLPEGAVQFRQGVADLRDAAGVREVFLSVMRAPGPAATASNLPAFLLRWTQIERSLAARAGDTSPGLRSVMFLLNRVKIPDDLRGELLELTRLRNRAVHGAPDIIDAEILQRAIQASAQLMSVGD